MTPATWREMVDRTRELEYALGDTVKRVAGNEQSTVVVQRRCLRAAHDLASGVVVAREALEALRPAPPDAISPFAIDSVIGKRLRAAVPAGEALTWGMLES
jgi:N-acetylneuraminate synthase